MAIPASSINATYRRFSFDVKIDGQRTQGIFEITCSSGIEQVNSQADLRLQYRPSWAEEGKLVEIWVYDQPNATGNSQVLFNGEIANADWEYGAGTSFKVDCRGKLHRLTKPWGGAERTYTSQTDGAVITNLIEVHGIPSNGHNIESSGWTLGTIVDVVLTENDVAWDLIERIDKNAGYRTWVLTTGTIVRRQVVGAPSVRPIWTYEKGVNIYNCRRSRQIDGIVNKVLVKGLEWEGTTIEAEYSAPNPYLEEINPTNPYIADEIADDLIEDQPKAEEVAARYVSDKNRHPEYFELEVPGNPELQAGLTVKIIHPSVEVPEGLLFVDTVSHTFNASGFVTNFRCSAGPLSGYRLIPPIAAFDFKMFLEHEDTGAGVSGKVVCIADGSSSSDTDSETALTFAWTASGSGGTPSPTSGSASVFYFTITSAATSVTVTLVVTDSDGLTATLAKTFTIDTSQLLIEDLYTAEGATIACSSDGQATWDTATPGGNATCLAPFASQNYQAWGFDNGFVRASFDKLKSTPISFGQPNGATAVVAVWIHETDDTRLWAATSDGKIYFGTVDTTAKTCTWALRGTLPATPPREIRESYGTKNELRATAGNNTYISQNGGTSWTLLQSGSGAAQRMAAGWDTNAAGFLADSTPVKYESGSNPAFPVLVPVVNGITGLSFGWQDKELYAVDDQSPARSFISDAALTTMTRKTDLGHVANHLIRSGNERRVVYASVGNGSSGVGGLQKSTDGLANWFYVRRIGTGKCYMAGYGAAHLPVVQASIEVIVVTTGLSAGNNGLYHHKSGVGWSSLLNTGLPSVVWYPIALVANPNNQSEWLLMINTNSNYPPVFTVVSNALKCGDSTTDCLFRTTDDGLTWTAVTLDASGLGFIAGASFGPVFSSSISDQWAIAFRKKQVPFTQTSVIWRGTGNASVDRILKTTNPTHVSIVADGLQGDYICAEDEIARQFCFYPATGGTIYPGPNVTFDPFIDRAPGLSPSAYCSDRRTDGSRIYYFKDYRNTSAGGLISLANGNISYVTVAANGDVLAGGRGNGALARQDVLRLNSFIYTYGVGASCVEAAISATAVTGGKRIGQVRAGRINRLAVAARIYSIEGATTGKDCWVSEDGGATWALLVGPAGAGNLDISDLVEVLERGGI